MLSKKNARRWIAFPKSYTGFPWVSCAKGVTISLEGAAKINKKGKVTFQ
jgi:hypothetical protein